MRACSGGGSGIRTHDRVAPITVFKSVVERTDRFSITFVEPPEVPEEVEVAVNNIIKDLIGVQRDTTPVDPSIISIEGGGSL